MFAVEWFLQGHSRHRAGWHKTEEDLECPLRSVADFVFRGCRGEVLEGRDQICNLNHSLWWSWEWLAGRARGRAAVPELL